MGNFEQLEMKQFGGNHISAVCLDKTAGWGQAQRGVGRERTWVVFAQSDSVDQELIKAFVDY